jgi:hypothetical protein
MSAHPHAGGLDVARPFALRSLAGRARVLLSAAVAAVLGAAPHVLHHAGPLAGAGCAGDRSRLWVAGGTQVLDHRVAPLCGRRSS